MTTLYMEANVAEDCPLVNDFGEVVTAEEDVPKHVRRNGYIKTSVVGVMGIMIFFGLVATYKFHGEVFMGNADADVALDELNANIGLWKKATSLQLKGDLFGGDKCPGYAKNVYASDAIMDYSAPMKGTKLVGTFKGLSGICKAMKVWDVYDMTGAKWIMYPKGNRIVVTTTWVPTLKKGDKAKNSETDVLVFWFGGGYITRQDVLWGNWNNLDALAGAPKAADTNPMIAYVKKMLISWRSGKFYGSGCKAYWTNHFAPGAVLDARAPIKAAGVSAKTTGATAGCAWFGAIQQYKGKNLKDIFYTKGKQIVQAQTFTIVKGSKSAPTGSAALFTFASNKVSVYDVFYYQPALMDQFAR